MRRIVAFNLFLLFCTAVFCFATEGERGTLSGKWITKDQGPMAGGQVLLFNAASGPPPSSNKHLRIPDAGTAIDREGKFSVKLPAGNYYLVMRKRANPESAGPPEEGDPQYYARLKNGQPKTFVVKAGKSTNIGTVTVAVPFKKEKMTSTEGLTGIEGTVTENAAPVAGARVLAYNSPAMQGRPLFASDKTGVDGRYFLVVSKPGSYYLKARTHYGGGKPVDGELMGGYGASENPGFVIVENGEISKGIDISVQKFSARQPPAP